MTQAEPHHSGPPSPSAGAPGAGSPRAGWRRPTRPGVGLGLADVAECRARQLPAQEISVPDLNTLLDQHVTLVYESVDRIFLNGYVAKLQEPDQLAWFLCQHRGEEIPRYELLGKMIREFVA